MAKKLKQGKDRPKGKVNIEGAGTGAPVPRKGGLDDQTKGKGAGTSKIKGFGGTGPFDHAGRK